MNQLFEWIAKLVSSWKFWIVIPPWDVGVRVRLGKSAVGLGPGPHSRIPFIDHIVLINTRLRITTVSPVTLSTQSERARYIRAVVFYRIADPLVAIMRYEWPAQAVQGFAQAAMASERDVEKVHTELVRQLHGSGVIIEHVRFTEDVEVPTVRLLQGEPYISSGDDGQPTHAGESRY